MLPPPFYFSSDSTEAGSCAQSQRTRPPELSLLNTVSPSLSGSDLFGCLPGSYTGAVARRAGLIASAHGGTVFLDEIDKAPREIQQQLLHLIEWGEFFPLGADKMVKVFVDFVVASNRSLRTLVNDGLFPHDLLARFGHFIVRVPTLRERRADLPHLVDHFVQGLMPRCGYSSAPAIDPDLLCALCDADWPNNLRDLESALALLLADAGGAPVITLRHVSSEIAFLLGGRQDRRVTDEELLDAWARSNHNQSQAARLLGIDRTTAIRRLKAKGLLVYGSAVGNPERVA